LLDHLFTLLPHRPDQITLIAAVIGSIIGLIMWIAAARFSRSILTLAAVALGTSIGMKLPLWAHWTIEPMAPAVGGAIVLGVSAYILHRFWVGMWLGAFLAIWTALVLWATRGTELHWHWTQYDSSQTLPQYLAALWQNVPIAMRQSLAVASAAAIVIGITAAMLWPRVGIALLWSAAGVSLLLPAAATALSKFDPAVLRHLPGQTSDQLALLAGIIGLGAIFQWRMIAAANPPGNALAANSDAAQSPEPKKKPKSTEAAD
jgi:hypothetical protein